MYRAKLNWVCASDAPKMCIEAKKMLKYSKIYSKSGFPHNKRTLGESEPAFQYVRSTHSKEEFLSRFVFNVRSLSLAICVLLPSVEATKPWAPIRSAQFY